MRGPAKRFWEAADGISWGGVRFLWLLAVVVSTPLLLWAVLASGHHSTLALGLTVLASVGVPWGAAVLFIRLGRRWWVPDVLLAGAPVAGVLLFGRDLAAGIGVAIALLVLMLLGRGAVKTWPWMVPGGRPRALLGIATGAIVAIGLAAGWTLGPPAPDCGAPAVDSGSEVGVLQLPVEPTALAGGRDLVYVVSARDDALVEVASDGWKRGPIPLAGAPSAIVRSYGSGPCGEGAHLWVALRDADSVVELDPDTMAVLRTVSVGHQPVALATSAWDSGAVWVANSGSDTIARIDSATGTVTATYPVGHDPRSLSPDPDGLVYVANHGDGTVSVVDSSGRRPTSTIPVGRGPTSVAYELGMTLFCDRDCIPTKVWVANGDDETVAWYEPGATTAMRTWNVPGHPVQVIPIGVRAWVLLRESGLVRIDDTPDHRLGSSAIATGSAPVAAIDVDYTQGMDLFWIAAAGDRSLLRRWSDR